jgi:predicted DNA-binding WGR domain protein
MSGTKHIKDTAKHFVQYDLEPILKKIPAELRRRAEDLWDLIDIVEKEDPRFPASKLEEAQSDAWFEYFLDRGLSDEEWQEQYGMWEDDVRGAFMDEAAEILKKKGLIGRRVKAGSNSKQRNKEGAMSSLRNRVIRLAHDNSELRTVLLPLLKQAHGPVALKNPEVMLYMIDKGKNSSKFYEMAVFPVNKAPNAKKDKGPGGDWVLSKHWGRLTDSGGTGRIDSENWYFASEAAAEAAMEKTRRTKGRKYTDVSRDREYPIGLGGAGFGWGGQAVCSIKPELRQLAKAVSIAVEELNDGMSMVGPLATTDSTMVKKLTGLLQHAIKDCGEIAAYLDSQLAEC